jgi:FkbM family methyltransferase
MIKRLELLISKVKRYRAQKRFLDEFGSLSFIDPIPDFVLKSKHYLRQLLLTPETKIHYSDHKLVITIQGIDYYPTTYEEIFILYEIFCNGIYNFVSPGPCLVLDIGMNVGFSSLFFASKDDVEKVIGYEPFMPTYKRALENLQLNPALASKICPVNLGIGIRDEKKSFDYSEEWKGNVSITNDPHFRPRAGTRVLQEEVTIVSADKIFKKIHDDYSNVRILCKMDCEGAEYEIFQSLSGLRGDQLPDAFMIEWHYRGDQEIADFLTQRGYFVFSFPHSEEGLGMVYAIRADSAKVLSN